MRGFTSPRKKTRGITLLSTLRKHLGCGKYTWTGWAVICLFLLFSAITVRLLILKRARQMNRLEPSAVAAREQFQIDESHTLSLLTGGSDTSNYFFLLVHGASREFQNAEHWLPHLQFFAQLGRVYAVDMLGHGASTPGGNDLSNHSVSALAQVRALQKLIAEKKRSHQQLVLVGRSYGGRIVLELANHLCDVHKIVLIAPALQQELVNGLREEVLSLPVLVFWAEDDTTVPYSRKKDTLDQFAAKEVVLFDHVLSEGQQAWEAHTPELIKVKEFQSKLRAWLVPA